MNRWHHFLFAAMAVLASIVLPNSHLLRARSPQGDSTQFRRIVTIAGNGETGEPVRQGRALQSPLSNPFGVQPQADGSLIIASFDQHVLYRLDSSYRSLETIAGTGTAGISGRDGDRASDVMLNQPHEVQVDQAGNIYVADTRNHRVGMIESDSLRWQWIAGTGEEGFSGDRGPAVRAKMNQAYSIALGSRTLFIADLKNHRIRTVDLASGRIETVCGTGQNAMPNHGGLAVEQPLAGPRSLALDQDNLWIVLREGNSVWRLDRHDDRIYHVAGTGQKGFSGDGGDARQATFSGPKGIAVDPAVAVYIADTENHAVRRIDLRNGRISTIVGATGQAGFDGDGDEVARRKLARPHGVCLLPGGNLLIGDSENHRLRMLEK